MATSETTTRAHRRGREARTGVPGRSPAQRAPELATFGLDELRAYRQELITEESRVSYWRRILQARLDLALGDESSLDRLRGVLCEHQESSRRLALLTLDDAAPSAPLPDLTVLWETEAVCEGGRGGGELLARLAAAEHELSAYRRSLHSRLDAATGDLIARYRDQPSLALQSLPRPRMVAVGVA